MGNVVEYRAKLPSESLIFSFDFSDILLDGATLTGTPTVSATKQDLVAGSTALTITAPALGSGNTEVTARIADGTKDENYQVMAVCTDTAGNILAVDFILQIRRADS
jgi:hypothetical protein